MSILPVLTMAQGRVFMMKQGKTPFKGQWEVRRVEREGFFKKDTRLTDTMVIFEIIGLQGSSDVGYVGKVKAKQFPRLKEVEENVFNCLKFNPIFGGTIFCSTRPES